jgi:hypothetical protein
MHGPSSQAHLLEIDHPYLPVDLGVAEAAGSADAQFVPSTEKPSDTLDDVPADLRVGTYCVAKAEVLSPTDQEAVEPWTQLGPGCRVSPEQLPRRGTAAPERCHPLGRRPFPLETGSHPWVSRVRERKAAAEKGRGNVRKRGVP